MFLSADLGVARLYDVEDREVQYKRVRVSIEKNESGLVIEIGGQTDGQNQIAHRFEINSLTRTMILPEGQTYTLQSNIGTSHHEVVPQGVTQVLVKKRWTSL